MITIAKTKSFATLIILVVILCEESYAKGGKAKTRVCCTLIIETELQYSAPIIYCNL